MHSLEIWAAICFAGSVLTSFVVRRFHVEVLFAMGAAAFITGYLVLGGWNLLALYWTTLHFYEPLLVFAIMLVCSTGIVLRIGRDVLEFLAKAIPLKGAIPFFAVALTVGPLLGSFITEPAAMTIIALLLNRKLYSHGISQKLKYATLGLLFVNVSIGGTLTNFAAPPILMIARKWDWSLQFVFLNLGWKAIVAVTVSTALVILQNRKELEKIPFADESAPWEYTGPRYREAFYVAIFLASLIILGGYQSWWVKPILRSLDDLSLYVGAIALTAVVDNAALTYLGSMVPDLSYTAKHALVAGSVVGGGLTVIANAPNPAGQGLLNSSFGEEGIRPERLFQAALLPTLAAALALWLL